jgi:hypothetical protein
MSRVSAFGEGQCESVQLLKRKLRVVIPGFQEHRCNVRTSISHCSLNEYCRRYKRTNDVIKMTLEELFDSQVVKEVTYMGGTLKYIAGPVLTHINPVQSLMPRLLYYLLSFNLSCKQM